MWLPLTEIVHFGQQVEIICMHVIIELRRRTVLFNNLNSYSFELTIICAVLALLTLFYSVFFTQYQKDQGRKQKNKKRKYNNYFSL